MDPSTILLKSVNKWRYSMLLFYSLNYKLHCPSPFITIIIIYSFVDMNALIWVSSIAIGLAAAALLCSNVTNVVGSGLPNSGRLLLSPATIKHLQLALFLENLELSYFLSGLLNITEQGTNRYPNNTIKIVSKVAAISEFLYPNPGALTDVYIVRRSPCCNYC